MQQIGFIYSLTTVPETRILRRTGLFLSCRLSCQTDFIITI